MLNNFGADDFGIPPINLEDYPFLNVPDDIDNVEVKIEDPFVDQNLFDTMLDQPMLMGEKANKKQKNRQV
jgi:hypothetical protein